MHFHPSILRAMWVCLQEPYLVLLHQWDHNLCWPVCLVRLVSVGSILDIFRAPTSHKEPQYTSSIIYKVLKVCIEESNFSRQSVGKELISEDVHHSLQLFCVKFWKYALDAPCHGLCTHFLDWLWCGWRLLGQRQSHHDTQVAFPRYIYWPFWIQSKALHILSLNH